MSIRRSFEWEKKTIIRYENLARPFYLILIKIDYEDDILLDYMQIYDK